MFDFKRFWTRCASGLITVVLLAALGCESTAPEQKGGYVARFGVMAPGPGGQFMVYAETEEIYRNTDKDYLHGFEVIRKDNGQFMGACEIRFPEPIKVTPELEKAYIVSEGGRVIRSMAEMYWGRYSVPFSFSEDDPLGTYQLTVFIDGEPFRTFQYEVVKFGY